MPRQEAHQLQAQAAHFTASQAALLKSKLLQAEQEAMISLRTVQ